MLVCSISASCSIQTFFNLKNCFFIITLLLLWQICCVTSDCIKTTTINGTENTQSYGKCQCLGDTVDCTGMKFISIPDDLPTWVTILILENNRIENFNFDDIKHLGKLEQLDLSSNRIGTNFTANSSYFPHLTNLKLNKNLFTRIPDFSSFKKLTHLSIAHNHINRISDYDLLLKLPNLQSFEIANNNLKILKRGSFSKPNSLEILNLNANKISEIQVGFFNNLTQLEELRLSRNKFKQIDTDRFANLKKLRILELNNNKIQQIQGLSFKNLTNLRKLFLKNNNINSINPGAFYGLTNLEVLELDNNNLSTIIKSFSLENLRKLGLSHNKIAEIDSKAWERFRELRKLDLSFNKLTVIEPDAFEFLLNLQELRINYNKITYISNDAFKYLPNLQLLEMSNNKISYMIEDISSGAFKSLNRLLVLGLASNQIKSINRHAFEGLAWLEELDLLGNNITTIQGNAFNSMPNLATLKMNTTSLVCDCSLLWFGKWLKKYKYRDVKVKCGYPHSLQNISLTRLHHVNITCDKFLKPRIIEGPKNEMGIKGENVTLSCRVSSTSNSPLYFVWKYENIELKNKYIEKIQHETNSSAIEVTSVLHLNNITNFDAGKYQCKVTNTFGTSYSHKAKVNVLVYPTFTKVPNDIFVSPGSIARLDCSAEGYPAPRIAWQKDGGHDFPAAKQRRMNMVPNDTVLFIVNVTAADSGIYSCSASNLAGSIAVNATLTIIEMPLLKPMKDQSIALGETVVFECLKIKGEPPPKQLWFKDGLPLSVTKRHYITPNDQFLIITDTQINDTGSYECQLNNSVGNDVQMSHLNVYSNLSSVESDDDTLRLIITGVCCIVITSILWIIIIYRFRRRVIASQNINGQVPIIRDGPTTQLYLDSSSQHSKDSGTGDSTNPSNDQLQFCLPDEVITCSINNDDDITITGEDPLLQFTNHQRNIDIDRKSMS